MKKAKQSTEESNQIDLFGYILSGFNYKFHLVIWNTSNYVVLKAVLNQCLFITSTYYLDMPSLTFLPLKLRLETPIRYWYIACQIFIAKLVFDDQLFHILA